MGSCVSQAEYETLASFRWHLRRFLHFSEQAARAAGVEPAQHQALLAVRGFPGSMTVGDLAERLQIRHHSAVGLVDRLEARGLLRRARAGARPQDARSSSGGSRRADRRQVGLRLTPRGSRLLERLSTVHREELRRLGPGLRRALARLADPGS